MFRRFAVGLAALCAASSAFAAPSARITPFGRLPVTFEKNTGRYDKRVRFLTRSGGATIFITQTELVMVMRGKATGEGQEASVSPSLSPAPSGGRGSGGGGSTKGSPSANAYPAFRTPPSHRRGRG